MTHRLARYGLNVLLVGVVIALIGGVVTALVWTPSPPDVQVGTCTNPPCFGGGGLPSVGDLPSVIPVMAYVTAIVLGLPSLLAGARRFVRRDRSSAARTLLVFVGPLLVFVGSELIPHVASPCLPAQLWGSSELPAICERTVHGVDVKDRWHLLDHALVGALPMTVLYLLALRRWRPDLLPRDPPRASKAA